MAQTDRQTDRSSAWIATAYNEEIDILRDATRYPSFVKEVHGDTEMCPSTGKLHFQGAIILHSQQRLSALKRWLPTAHLEAARSREAIKKYCMKQETAVGVKQVRVNAHPYFRMDELLTMLGNVIGSLRRSDIEHYINLITEDEDRSKEYWYAVNDVIKTYPRTISSFSQSALRTAWRYTANHWIQQPTLSITESADNSNPQAVDLNSPAGIYNGVPEVFEVEACSEESEAVSSS